MDDDKRSSAKAVVLLCDSAMTAERETAMLHKPNAACRAVVRKRSKQYGKIVAKWPLEDS